MESIKNPNPIPPIIITPRPIKITPPICELLDSFLSLDAFKNIIYPGIKKASPIAIKIIRERKKPILIPNPVFIRDFKEGEFLAICF